MKANLTKDQIKKRKIIIRILIVLGFMAMELPGILIVRKFIEPFIFGFPFLYGYMGICWVYICAVMFYAFKTAWGRKTFFKKRNTD